MRAIVVHSAKDLRLDQQPETSPGPGQVAIKVRAGGICGSDLHYFNNGGFGAIRIKEPMILGHEVSGEIASIGEGVEGLAVGNRVAINPSLPCLQCEYCQLGQHNHCLDMRFYGSAMRFPHVQGAFSERLICEARQCVVLPQATDFHLAAFAEPLSVALHGINRIAEVGQGLSGKRVLVSGCGPIGALAIMAARHSGAMEIVAVDVADHVLSVASTVGADHTVNVANNTSALKQFEGGRGYFDVVIEASGTESALHSAIQLIRPRGVLMQLGLGGDVTIPINTCVSKEIALIGTFRFHEEFNWAAQLIGQGVLDLSPLLSAAIPMESAAEAFALAGDRSQAVKVQIAFN
ncbi:MAG: L-idonate 5-dehydrogenase [Parasphingorhabdus sp.]|jgi:L-idonate 5-dehydrogenase